VYCGVEYIDVSRKQEQIKADEVMELAHVPRRYSVDVEIRKCDVDARFVCAVEEIVALDVAWVQTWVVG